MKRLLLLFLALCMALLCACGAAKPAAAQDPPAETPVPATERPVPAEAAALTPILAEIRERMYPGTAGSSLTALQLASMLLDWCQETEADGSQIRAAVKAFLAPLSELERAEFGLQMGSVQAAAERLFGEDSAALMDDIGGTEGTLWPWTDLPKDKLETLFSAAGADSIAFDPNA